MNDAQTFETFDLTVLYAGNPAGIWLSASSRLGAVHAFPRRDLSHFPLNALTNDVAWFRNAISSGSAADEQAKQFGMLLTNLIFGVDEIASLFRRTRGAANAESRSVLLRLLAAPERIAALPWELLLDPDDPESPLLFAPDTYLARLARDRRYPLRVDPIAPPLNVLLVLSNPSEPRGDEDVPFDHYEEGRALLAELEELIDRGVLLVDVEDRPSIENLRRRIGSRERGYHVVHYLGHASPDALKLETSAGLPSWIPGATFNGLLRTCQDLRLTFFAGCRTATVPPQNGNGEFASQLSVADRCVREACQTVLGMQAVLPFRTEQVLTRFFYQALCTGATVARALSLARAAARDDETLGRGLLNWAVPSLVTGHVPGAIVDPDATPAVRPPPKPRRAQLKLELVEPDREFFARFEQLREAVSVLCRKGQNPNRVVWVTGPPGAGKSRLLARALDELDESVVAVLYVSALRLARKRDPVAELCKLVNELLKRAQREGLARERGWRSDEWWDRLIEELVDTPFVLAIDDIDRLDPPLETSLGSVVDRLVARVSKARIALAGGDEMRNGFLSETTQVVVSKVHLLTLEPREVIQWVRRNRPALSTALAGRTEVELGTIHNRLGFKLHLWSRLAEEYDRQVVKDLLAAVDRVVGAEEAAAAPPEGAAEPGAAASPDKGTRGPLRVAIAGPFLASRQREFADGVSALALAHGVGARVVEPSALDAATAVAHLLPMTSPFSADGAASSTAVLKWLNELFGLKPDLVLLDYGGGKPSRTEETMLRRLADGGSLLIAAAGNGGVPAWPAWYDFVLAVGAVNVTGRREKYSKFFPDVGKPEVFALGTVTGTPLEHVPDVPAGTSRGTSFAALNAVAAATVVWAHDRTMTSTHVHDLLLETAVPFGRGRVRSKRLDLNRGLNAVKVRLIARALLAGPLTEQSVAAASGLSLDVLRPLLDALTQRKAVRREGDRYIGDTEVLSAGLSGQPVTEGRSDEKGR